MRSSEGSKRRFRFCKHPIEMLDYAKQAGSTEPACRIENATYYFTLKTIWVGLTNFSATTKQAIAVKK